MTGARLRVSLLAASALFLAGCASAPKTERALAQDEGPWSGRLALQVEGNQSQSFAAGFDLRGNAASGELTLSNPLGGTLAVLSWAPGSAMLRNGGQTRQFESVDALVAHATGSAIPVAALFDWLRGTNTPVPGWQANLSLLPQGRLSAHRTHPQPEADLRIALER
ncbi:outer membrane lipoprotein LolB [Caenimonas aquaedulcis]|uniref:Outer-membrane lipoprotein LolB n=1 Tax=Caenimonas aquaedulcis TaxID=2793270 RepID=A0A931H6M3_9BURK|nr:outer membrane lipoprotein LolB [Caenimonas aquaedulcis]MBG9389561.1 outer membrane lipoprotein LolB [Caenimonas aquaedulcis]